VGWNFNFKIYFSCLPHFSRQTTRHWISINTMQPFPVASENQNYVTVHALSAGFLTWPEHYFVKPSVEGTRNTVPSLAFLIQHHHATTGKLTRILFDLGIRKNIKTYPVALQKHLASNLSVTTEPDVSDSLALGNLTPQDINYVILSHVHWDHVGTPSDFRTSRFVVGKGSLELLASAGNPPPIGSQSFFEADLLPSERTTELPSVGGVSEAGASRGTVVCSGLPNDIIEPMVEEYFSLNVGPVKSVELKFGEEGCVATVSFELAEDASRAVGMVDGVQVDGKPLKVELVNGAGLKEGGLFSNVKWQKFGPLANVIDIFSDGSVYLVDSPGHLDGHLNLLARLGAGKFLYLAGDACHDRRIMRGELEIATWKDLHGKECCIHADKEATEKTIELLVELEKMDGVEVVLGHDVEWLNEEGNKERFWPGKM
jgi:glyoxylase-like metal-dependent hydrolase (beta-lactamase superfamily II)